MVRSSLDELSVNVPPTRALEGVPRSASSGRVELVDINPPMVLVVGLPMTHTKIAWLTREKALSIPFTAPVVAVEIVWEPFATRRVSPKPSSSTSSS